LEEGWAYTGDYFNYRGIAPWQHDYFTWTIGHLVELNFTGAKTFFPWISKFALQRMTGEPGYCWNVATPYDLMTRPNSTSPAFASMTVVFEKNFPNIVKRKLACNSQAFMDELTATNGSGTYTINRMIGRSDSATSYYKFLQPALAMIVDYAPNKGMANLAWSRHQSNPKSASAAKRNDTPIYAIVPRSSLVTARPGDTDGDGLPDEWEISNFKNLTTSDGWSDTDKDGLTDADEYKYQTDPKNDDTDGDGYKDGAEIKWGADPTSASDTKVQHQPNQPQFTDIANTIPVYGFFFEISGYVDPDSDDLSETQWQISTDNQFSTPVFDRKVMGSLGSLRIPPGVLTPSTSYFIRSAYIDATTLKGYWSETINITTQSSYPNDSDGNIVDDTYQIRAITATKTQTCTLMDAQSNNAIILEVNNGSILCFTSYFTSTIDAATVPFEGLPYGLTSFTINNINSNNPVNLTIEFPETVNANNSWYQFDIINGLLNKAQAVQYLGNSVIITLQDAGKGDIDGVTNNTISSAGGLGGVSGSSVTPVAPINPEPGSPTISNSDTKDSGIGSIDFVMWLILLIVVSIRYCPIRPQKV